jgi:hypothetical protein
LSAHFLFRRRRVQRPLQHRRPRAQQK